jgi:predicted dinucleotide-utilizing enzyme
MKRIAVIGIGSLGGALCKNIAEMESIDELIVVDYDRVESKNIHNSVYTASQIGEKKVDALAELLVENINVITLHEKYIEGKTVLPECDLIVDCRDVVCSRGNEIDVRLYITGKILIIDCRKNVKTQYDYEGSYRRQLPKSELNKAGFFAAQIICSDQINQLLEDKSVQRVDLNLLSSIINDAMKQCIENRVDIIYDAVDGLDRIHCLEENIEPILNLSKSKNVDVYVGEKESRTLSLFKTPVMFDNFPSEAKTKYAVIPRNSLRNSNDLINCLTTIVKEQNNIVNFIVTLRKENGETFVELLEETGAA